MTVHINRDEWLAALREAEDPGDPESVTVQEFAGLIGLHRCAAQQRLNLLVEKGLAQKTYKFKQNDRNQRVKLPAYRLVKAAPAAAPAKGKKR